MDLSGKVACVTGATGGIGEECAAELAGRGATVVLGVRNSKKAAETLQKIKSRYPDADVVEGLPLDMANPDSIRAFAAEWEQSGRALHILVNNAGALTFTNNHVGHGVAELCQVNYLGPYLLTRLLERVLIRSAPSRVVNVSSVTHRYGVIGDPWVDFLKGPQGHYYENTKLANVLHAYETQRRLGRFGVQACAVDPGSVCTGIWRNTPLVQRITEFVWAPPSVGALPLVYAATVAWDDVHDLSSDVTQNAQQDGVSHQNGHDLAAAAVQENCHQATLEGAQENGYQSGRDECRQKGLKGLNGDSQLVAQPQQIFRYFAPKAFATPLLLWYTPEGNRGWLGRQLLKRGSHASSLLGALKQSVWVVMAFAVSGVDWPIRQLSKGTLLNEIVAAPSSTLSYDADLAAQLWNASADVAGVPREVQVPA